MRGGCAYFVGDLELLALADIGGLGDGVLELRESLVVKGLQRMSAKTKELPFISFL